MAVLTARTALLVNPASRRGASAEASVLRAFHAAGVQPTVEYTRCAGDGVRAARAVAASAEVVFVLGGDGTVMEASTGLADAGSSAAIGILPGGTGNQLARALSIPLSPARAVGALLHGVGCRIDLGILNGRRRVGIGAGLGLDATMIARAQGPMKKYLGAASYLAAVTPPSLRPHRFALRAEVDGRVIERDAAVAMMLNLGRIFGGMFEVATGVSLVDGLLDLVILDARHLGDMLSFAVLETMLRYRRPDRRWTLARGCSLSIETSDASVLAQVDGDLIDGRRLQLSVAPLAAHLLVPASVRII